MHTHTHARTHTYTPTHTPTHPPPCTRSSDNPPSKHAELFWTCRPLVLWHILYVNHACRVPVDSPQRFRVELLFSPGASFNPYEVVPLHKDHTLPVQPRACLHKGGIALHKLLHLVGNATLLLFSAFMIHVGQSPLLQQASSPAMSKRHITQCLCIWCKGCAEP